MTPAQFTAARKRLGLSAEEMAAFLRLKDGRSVRRYEDGSREISGPIEKCIALNDLRLKLIRALEEAGAWVDDDDQNAEIDTLIAEARKAV